jgi:ATP-dependent Lhr-like helicase
LEEDEKLIMATNPFELFSKSILEEIKIFGWEKPTEIQRKAIPLILEGKNVLLIAPTGTGKTEAAVLPLFELFSKLHSSGETSLGISILYITPLRALNRDILRRLIEVGKNLGIKIEVRHGDTPANVRSMQAKMPPNMLITTPETLQAILPGKIMKEHLKNVRWVVVDEIHELACDKRGVQLTIALERLFVLTGRDFQRIGLSATVGNPDLIGKFLVGKGRTVYIIRTEAFKEMAVNVESPPATRADEELASKLFIPAGTVCRVRRILELMSRYRTLLIFTNTREHAESLASKIRMLSPLSKVGIHHGSLSREGRIETEQQMKTGELKAVICTSSLELGIDVGAIDCVVQVMSPRQVTKIVQRVGRSGHLVEGKSNGIIIASLPDDILESVVILRRALNGKLEEPSIHFNALDALAHQIAGLVSDYGSIFIDNAYKIVTRAYPYCNLSVEVFWDVVRQLENSRNIRVFDESKIKFHPRNTRRYYYENISMIPDVKQYVVFDFMSRRKIGFLDQEFVAKHGRPGCQFILHGQVWRILNVDEEKYVMEVEGVEPSLAAIPGWEGEIIPVPFEVAQEVGELRRKIADQILRPDECNDAFTGYRLDDNSKKKVVNAIKKQLEGGFILPHDRQIVIEAFENYVIIHSCFGDKCNQTFSRIIASLLTSKTGLEIGVQSDPYRIALIAPHPLDPVVVKNIITSLNSKDIPNMIKNVIDQTTLFIWRMWHVAKRFGVVSREADYKLRYAQALLRTLKGTPVYNETLREIFLEKLDVENTTKIVELINSDEVKVEVEPSKIEPSPLSLPILDKIAPQDLLQPVKERKEIITLLKERLNTKTVKLVCAFKGDWEGNFTVRSIPEKPRCPTCKSTLLATTYPDDKETKSTIMKKVNRKKLSEEEEKKWLNIWKNASLIQNYGKNAIIAMTARGVGPTTATRILHKLYKTENDFYMAILKAERDYLRTKMFWD